MIITDKSLEEVQKELRSITKTEKLVGRISNDWFLVEKHEVHYMQYNKRRLVFSVNGKITQLDKRVELECYLETNAEIILLVMLSIMGILVTLILYGLGGMSIHGVMWGGGLSGGVFLLSQMLNLISKDAQKSFVERLSNRLEARSNA